MTQRVLLTYIVHFAFYCCIHLMVGLGVLLSSCWFL